MASKRMMDPQQQVESAGQGTAAAEPLDLPELDLGADDQVVEAALERVQSRFDAWLATHELAQAEWQRLDQAREKPAQPDGDLQERQASLQTRAAQLDEQTAELEARQAAFEVSSQERQAALDARAAEIEAAEDLLTDPVGAAAQPDPAPSAEPLADGASPSSSDQATAEAGDSSGPPPVAASPEGLGTNAERQEPASPLDEKAVDPPPGCAELEAQADPQPARAVEPGSQTEPTDNRSPASDVPAAQTGAADAGSEKHEQRNGKPEEAPGPTLDLDPATARKLRVLRRLHGPGKSDAELLAQIDARNVADPAKPRGKKHWWKRDS